MKGKLVLASAAFLMGVVGGQLVENLLNPAYAQYAPNEVTLVLIHPKAILVKSVEEVLAQCDFDKTIVAIPTNDGGIACAQKE